VEPAEISEGETKTSITTWTTPDQLVGLNPAKFMIWLFQPPVPKAVTLTWSEWVPWVTFDVDKLRAALVPFQAPFSVRLSAPLKSTAQAGGRGVGLNVGLAVAVIVEVAVFVGVKVAVGNVPVGVAEAVEVTVAVAVAVGLAVGVKVRTPWLRVIS
jgi:hypothetical protein